jgi:methanogenic corrinoid protein MtbC1
VVLACLPEERHGLGLQVVALEVVAAGRRALVLGLQTPVEEIIAAVEAADAVAVGLSVSLFAQTEATHRQITRLRAGLPSGIALWVGGAGAASLGSLPDSVQTITSMDGLAAAVRALPS